MSSPGKYPRVRPTQQGLSHLGSQSPLIQPLTPQISGMGQPLPQQQATHYGRGNQPLIQFSSSSGGGVPSQPPMPTPHQPSPMSANLQLLQTLNIGGAGQSQAPGYQASLAQSQLPGPPSQGSIEVPELNTDPQYVLYSRTKRLFAAHNQPISHFDTYEPFPTPGPPIAFGRKKDNVMVYPTPGPTSLRQSDSEYSLNHPSEELLPRAQDSRERRAVYGTHQDLPLQGAGNFDQYFKSWHDIGQQYKEPIPSGEALTALEIDFCDKYGFTFDRELGSGSYGKVWLVNTTRVFSEKVPDPQHPQDPDKFVRNYIPKQLACKISNIIKFNQRNQSLQTAVEKLLREVDIQKSLDHVNIVKCEYMLGIHDQITGFPYCRLLVFMELCEGDLGDRIRRSPGKRLTEDQAKIVMVDLCNGLQYLHDENVCHLDIKPRNVMYVYVNDPANGIQRIVYKWADFGLSKRFPKTTVGQLGGPLGTTKYMAPELPKIVQTRTPVNAKPADIFSLGCLLTEAVVGQVLWENALVRFHQSKGSVAEKCNRYRIGLKAGLLICKMTVEEPNRRPTIADVIHDPWFEP